MPDLASVDDLAVWTGQTVEPFHAAALLDAAESAVVAAANGARLAAPDVDIVETVRAQGQPTIILKHWPVTDVTAVTVNGDAVDLDTVDWFEWGGVQRASCWHRGDVVDVTYRAGLQNVATAVKTIVLAVAARLLANPQQLNSFGGDGTSAVFPRGDGAGVTLSHDERRMLAEALT